MKYFEILSRLDLPEYKSYEELRSKIVTAIEESAGFDGVDWLVLYKLNWRHHYIIW